MSTPDNPNTTEAATVAALALSGVAPRLVDTGDLYAIPDGQGGVRVITTDEYAATPRHVGAKRTVRDAESFVGYLGKHALDETEVWADSTTSSIVAVIDSHQGAHEPGGWQKHSVHLELRHTDSWLAWAGIDGQLLTQDVFADFIEGRSVDVVKPDPASFLELAQSFQAKQNVDFESGHRLDSGQVRLEFKETITAKAGQKGNIDIPTEVELALKPYVGGPVYKVRARFRYRFGAQGLRLSIVLLRPADLLEAAFTDIVTEIRDGKRNPMNKQGDEDEFLHFGIAAPIFSGRP